MKLHTSQRGIGFVKAGSRPARDEEPLLVSNDVTSINGDSNDGYLAITISSSGRKGGGV
jgi:hypothetical protein